jgi:Beta-propeller repeat
VTPTINKEKADFVVTMNWTATYLGGSTDDFGYGVAVDAAGNAYIAGLTDSIDFPTKYPLQPTFGGSNADAFVSKINPDGSALVYSTYLGGSEAAAAAMPTGRTPS